MLTTFIMKRTFYTTQVSLYVDCEARQASVTVTHKRLILRMEDVAYWQVDTIDKATAWLSRPCGLSGNFIETLHHQATHGLLPQKVTA